MRNYSYIAVWVVVLVLALAVTAFANGATYGVGSEPPPPSVQVVPEPPVGAGAGTVTTTPTMPTATTPQTCYPMSQLVTLTVAQAWELSGMNYNSMGQIVQAMTDMSANNRGLDIPDTREAGAEIGRYIRQKAEADPNQLLYSVVDSSVVQYASMHGITPVAG